MARPTFCHFFSNYETKTPEIDVKQSELIGKQRLNANH